MKNQSPYKWTFMPRVMAQGKGVYELFNYYRPNRKCSKDKLLIDESNGNKVFRLPVIQSSFNGWKDPVFKIASFFIIF